MARLSKIAAQVALLCEVLSALRAPPLRSRGLAGRRVGGDLQGEPDVWRARPVPAAAEGASNFQYSHQVARLTHAAALLNDAAKIRARLVSAAVKRVYADALARSSRPRAGEEDKRRCTAAGAPDRLAARRRAARVVGQRAAARPRRAGVAQPARRPVRPHRPRRRRHRLALQNAGKGIADDLCAKMLEAVGAGAERLSALDLPAAGVRHGDEGALRPT